jgi:hypothetical protein
MKWLIRGFLGFMLLGLVLIPAIAQDGDGTSPPPKEGDETPAPPKEGDETPAPPKEGDGAEPPPPLDEEAKAWAKEFKANYKKQSSPDLIGAVDKMVEYLKNPRVTDEKVRGELLDCLGILQGHHDKVVVAHVMKKCGVVGEESLKIVLSGLNRELKAKLPDDKVCEAALETVGKIKSESPIAIKLLNDLLKNKDDSLIARAAFTMSMYEGASGRIRKDFFEELLKSSEGVYSKQQGGDEAMKRKWTIIGDDMVGALNKLSLPPRKEADFSDPTKARKWFNDNKKLNWDKQD